MPWPFPSLAISGAWLAFFVYWYATARRVKPTIERESLRSGLSHRLPLCAAAILLIGRYNTGLLGRRWLPYNGATAGIAIAITFLGLAAAIWARRTLGANWSSAVTLKAAHELIERGPYRWVRNPIYTSMLLMFAGTAILIGRSRALLALVLAVAALWIKLRQEERFLLRQFPDTYPAYCRRVRALVPFVF